MAPAWGAQLGGLLAEQFWGLSHTCQPRRFQRRCSKSVLPFSLSAPRPPAPGWVPRPAGPLPGGGSRAPGWETAAPAKNRVCKDEACLCVRAGVSACMPCCLVLR